MYDPLSVGYSNQCNIWIHTFCEKQCFRIWSNGKILNKTDFSKTVYLLNIWTYNEYFMIAVTTPKAYNAFFFSTFVVNLQYIFTV